MVEITLRSTYVLAKRTRLNVKQSKNGCYTCKAKHLKCDETRPHCTRCQQARRQCLGYAETRSDLPPGSQAVTKSLELHEKHSTPYVLHSRPISYGGQQTEQDLRHYALGQEALLGEGQGHASNTISVDWIRLLRQVASTNDTVRQATICFGTVWGNLLLQPSSRDSSITLKALSKALSSLRLEIERLEDGLAPTVIACVILAATEVLLRRLPNALIHVRGAIECLSHLSSVGWCKHRLKSSSNLLPLSEFHRHHLQAIVLGMDMHTAWYRLDQPPDIVQSPNVKFGSIVSFDKTRLMVFLHDCYHFSSRAAHFKYSSKNQIPLQIQNEQWYLIAAMRTWLQNYQARPHSHRIHTSDDDHYFWTVLKVQLLSTLIFLSTILQPYEAAYDSYSDLFCDILHTSEDLIGESHRLGIHTDTPAFHLQPSIFQPLYFTAMKFRHSAHRRRAIHLFSQLGFEGPWNSRIMAGIASKAVAMEEEDIDWQGAAGEYPDMHVPELIRIHGCGFVSQPDEIYEFPVTIKAEFSQCVDTKGMVEASESAKDQYWQISSHCITISDYI